MNEYQELVDRVCEAMGYDKDECICTDVSVCCGRLQEVLVEIGQARDALNMIVFTLGESRLPHQHAVDEAYRIAKAALIPAADAQAKKRCSYCDHYAVTGSWKCEICGRQGADVPVADGQKHHDPDGGWPKYPDNWTNLMMIESPIDRRRSLMNDDNVTHIINAKTIGMDQLAGFDANGDPGPGVTIESACAEVKRLHGREKAAFMAGFKINPDCRMGELHTAPDPKQAWQEYLIQSEKD